MRRSPAALSLALLVAPLVLAVAGALVVAEEARADDAVQIELVPKALQGEGQPALVVKAQTSLAHARLELVRSTDKKRIVAEVKGLAAGKSHAFPLPLPAPGRARFEGKLSIALDDGQTGEMPIAVEAELVGPLVLTVAPEDLALASRTLTVGASRPIEKVELSLTSDRGTPLEGVETAAEGTRATVTWPASQETVLRIHVRAWDADGFFGAVELFPWRIEIPHEEINFASGAHDIPASEAAKLEGSFTEITGAIDKYGKLATIRLFIAGHTDTVGDASSNRGLSERRAQAIARWFAKRGVKVPILTAGFGEDVPLVKTADEVDEARNRRAEYIVAVDAPTVRGGQPWKPLR